MDEQASPTGASQPEATAAPSGPTLELPEATKNALGKQRVALRSAMDDLEASLARPVAGGLDWLTRVSAAQQRLRVALQQHIEVHEGADSFHAQVVSEQPGLAARVQKLQREHVRASAQCEELAALIAAAQPDDYGQIRQTGGDLLILLAQHRQRGADLVWESANLDLGGGD